VYPNLRDQAAGGSREREREREHYCSGRLRACGLGSRALSRRDRASGATPKSLLATYGTLAAQQTSHLPDLGHNPNLHDDQTESRRLYFSWTTASIGINTYFGVDNRKHLMGFDEWQTIEYAKSTANQLWSKKNGAGQRLSYLMMVVFVRAGMFGSVDCRVTVLPLKSMVSR